MFDAQKVKELIEKGLPCEYVEVVGDDGVHFSSIVVSETFRGKSLVNQHKAVKATLGSLMGNEIHALQLKTFTPEKWAEFQQELGD